MPGLAAVVVTAVLAIAGAALPASALANASLATGFGATAATDRDGVTHVVYGNRPAQIGSDEVSYCRIAPGTDTCRDTRVFPAPSGCVRRDPSTSENNNIARAVDPPRVLISQFGDVIIVTHAGCNLSNGAVDDNLVIYQSTDGGDTFADPLPLARRSSLKSPGDEVGGDVRRVWSDSVLDPADRRIVTVTSQDYTCCDSAQYGGVFVQGAPLGINYTNVRARLTDDTDTRNRAGGGHHPTVVQRGAGSFVVAWVDPDTKIQLRAFDQPGAPLAAINDAANWTTIAGPDETGADRPQLVTGPLGTFLLYRVTPAGSDPVWRLRRLTGTTLGAAQPIPDLALAHDSTGNYIRQFGAHPDGSASLVEDQANGRLHFARWYPAASGQNHMQYMTSDDGVGWSPNVIMPASSGGLSDTHDFGTGGWVAQMDFPDPFLGEATGTGGFFGTVGQPVLPSGFPFGAMTLPGTSPPPPAGGGGGDGGGGGGGTTPPPPGTTPPPATPGPPPANPEDTRCRVLQLAALDVVANACFTVDKGVYVAKGGVKVNGMEITGAEVRFDPKALRVTSTGPVDVSVGATDLFHGAIDWKIPKGNTFPLGDLDVGRLGSRVFGFKLVGDANVVLVRGAVEIHANVGLPDLLGGLSASLVLRADNIAGLHVRELHFGFATAKLGPLELSGAALGYDSEENRWEGNLKLSIPPGMVLSASIGIRDGTIEHLDGEFVPPAPGYPLDPFSVAYLTAIRGGVAFSPLTFSGGVTLGAGPQIKTGGSDRAVRVDGDVKVTLPDGKPVTIRGDGVGSVLGIPMARAYVQYVTDGHINAGGSVKYDFGPFHADGAVDGWFYRGAFNLEGKADVCAGICIGGDLLFSSKGFAACARTPVLDIGAGITWGNDLVAGLVNPVYLLTKIDLMPVGCSVGDYREPAGASAAQAGAERSVTFRAGLPAGVVGVIGRDGPPHVALVGPDGTRVEPQPGAPVNTGAAFAFQAAAQRLTWFAVKQPRAGVWRIVPEADSTPVVRVRQADGLPAPRVTARVRRGTGARRVLTYTVAPLPGQQVTFAEVGRGAAAQIGVARGATGRLTFTPTPGDGGTRRIVATVSQRGIPRANLTVARYVAPPRARPAKPRLTLRRRGTRLTIAWRRDRLARRFEVRVALSDGRTLLLLPKAPKATVSAVARTTTARVAVRGLDRAGIAGPRATATSRPAKARARRAAAAAVWRAA